MQIRFLLSILVVVAIELPTAAGINGFQSDVGSQNSWFTYSTDTEGFMIEVPDKLVRFAKLDPESSNETEKRFFKCTRSVSAYRLRPASTNLPIIFAVGVFDVSGCVRSPELFEKEVIAISQILGGDEKVIVSESFKKVHGLQAFEFVHSNGDSHGRILMVNADKRIYLLIRRGKTRDELFDTDSVRLFGSFRPTNIK